MKNKQMKEKVENYLKKNFPKTKIEFNSAIAKTSEGVEVYGTYGLEVLVRKIGDVLLYKPVLKNIKN